MQTTRLTQVSGFLGLGFFAALLIVALPAEAADNFKTLSNVSQSKSAQAVSRNAEITPEDASAPAVANEAVAAAQAAAPMADNLNSSDALAGFGPSSGTVVGNRALELRDEVLRLRSSVSLNANEFNLLRANGAAGAVQYHSTVAAITARLQNGTTRGNPILLRQWEEAEASLNEVTNSLNRLNSLQTTVAADASLSGYLLESIQAAFQLSGAVDEDHDQLKLLRDEISRVIVQVDYMRNQVTDDIQRQTAYATSERSNLQTLAFAISRGELLGNSSNHPVIVTPSPVASLPANPVSYNPGSYAPTPMAAPSGQVGPAPMSPREMMQETSMGGAAPAVDVGVAPSTGRLLVLIRYNQPVVEYEQQLSQAVSSTLERRPNSEFSVVAVVPASGEPNELARSQEVANRNAEAVKRSLVQLGLPASRINMSTTQTQTAQTAEVHVYVR